MDSNTISIDFSKLVNIILEKYATTCNIKPFDGNIFIADDMTKAYSKIRKDHIDNQKIDINSISNYNGLTIPPKENNGKFTILLNKDYLIQSMKDGNYNWVGTIIHEATHVNDFLNYFSMVSPKSYDELYEYNLHRMFLYWTEFHAKAIGYYFLRKYSFDNVRDLSLVNGIIKTELPFQVDYMVKEVSATNNADRQMYVIVHFLGRLAVWQYLYPSTFDKDFIHQLLCAKPWAEELYYFLIKYSTLEEIHPHFEEMKSILLKNYSEM